MKMMTLEQLPPPTHVNVERQFSQELRKKEKNLEVVKRVIWQKYFEKTGKIIYQQA